MMRVNDINELHDYLLIIPQNKIIEMRDKGKKIFDTFCSHENFINQILQFYNLF